jgi:hypothetical protein
VDAYFAAASVNPFHDTSVVFRKEVDSKAFLHAQGNPPVLLDHVCETCSLEEIDLPNRPTAHCHDAFKDKRIQVISSFWFPFQLPIVFVSLVL